jgi:hypothetical protein
MPIVVRIKGQDITVDPKLNCKKTGVFRYEMIYKSTIDYMAASFISPLSDDRLCWMLWG